MADKVIYGILWSFATYMELKSCGFTGFCIAGTSMAIASMDKSQLSFHLSKTFCNCEHLLNWLNSGSGNSRDSVLVTYPFCSCRRYLRSLQLWIMKVVLSRWLKSKILVFLIFKNSQLLYLWNHVRKIWCPKFVLKCRDFSGNQLTGPFPSQFNNTGTLQEYSIARNHFSGEIPPHTFEALTQLITL